MKLILASNSKQRKTIFDMLDFKKKIEKLGYKLSDFELKK